jgi:hypothetical protein
MVLIVAFREFYTKQTPSLKCLFLFEMFEKLGFNPSNISNVLNISNVKT